ncbi:probable LRR receptor-like serine/threonine-protein kinase RPK1 [Benincasa hispida]|uniref:probable LRR receptor-like serine/threonine-protein kinase RPK1 n=1 Tax=Benincasa hispida TaxID=102211 RepID=UPI001900F789|nr:probable LRR receptor-like serine/threonine-protein kinase RPK1 [Benincasa hispida]
MIERMNVMIDVALALEYLHDGFGEPIVHCDLKPSNILLDEEMVAHLTDFGVSKLLGGGDSITQTMTLATVGYMAPDSDLLTKNDEALNYWTAIECLSSIISLALSCTVESPEKRPSAKYVLDSLNNIKKNFMKYERS